MNKDNDPRMTAGAGERIGVGRGLVAVSPIVVFLLFYLAVSIAIGDFYKMPISVALLIASAWAVVIQRGRSIAGSVEEFSRTAGSPDVLYMIWIFILAGAFATLAVKVGAVDATVNLALRYLPTQLIIPGLFMAACFISVAIGTSVGTVVALTPLAVEMAQSGGGDVPFFVAITLGGAFFGDNLSFISDTTIAATRTQGCAMRDKFRANLKIVLPAALITLALYVFLGAEVPDMTPATAANYWLITPYMLVIVTALMGINVTVVLAMGIVATLVLGWIEGFGTIEMFGFMGTGIEGVGGLVIITLLAAGMLGLIKAAGGIQFILQALTARISGRRGAQGAVAVLVGIVNLCTANNTVAIITVGPLARDIARRFDIQPRRMASILDTCSCIVQCLIPYGAQTLLATGLAGISPTAPFGYLYYPWALTLCVALAIALPARRAKI